MAQKKRPGERRTYPWRAALTDVACSGTTHAGATGPHLPLVYAELEQHDPQGFPYEWTCPRCGLTAPSSWWDQQVPVPPHSFVEGGGDFFFVALNWQCRVCLQASDNRMFHPAPAVQPFDPSRLDRDDFIEESGEWAIVIDESLGVMETYVSQDLKVVAMNSETWNVCNSDDEAYERLVEPDADASGMRFLAGVPVFDKALRKFRGERGQDAVQAKDEITQLAELLDSLATQAVSLGADGDQEQNEILMGRYLQARTRVETLRNRLNELDGKLDLVAMGVIFG